MDDDTSSLFKTVCVAGCASPGFNGDSNARLDQLVDAGLLNVANPQTEAPKTELPRRYYRPSEMGISLYRQMKEKGAA
jgi:hypothetical protein